MAYSESLAGRVRACLATTRNIVEKKMFGGVAFLLHGNMLVGVWQTALIARVGPEQYETALEEAHVREFDATGKPMRGWVLVEPDGLESDHELRAWIARAQRFVGTLEKK